ncbi:hypothetical protein, partial [Candidatus Binatus sp.]
MAWLKELLEILRWVFTWSAIDWAWGKIRETLSGKATIAFMTALITGVYAYFNSHPMLLAGSIGAVVACAAIVTWTFIQGRLSPRYRRSERPLHPDALDAIDLHIDLLWRDIASHSEWPEEIKAVLNPIP